MPAVLRSAHPRRGRWCGALVVGSALTIWAQVASAAEQRIEFDVPAQPLASALDAYIAVTGFVVVYNGNLAMGQLSHPVTGRLTPEVALSLLLEDSGLVAEYTTANAFVLLPAPGKSAVVKTPLTIALAALLQQGSSERRYSALLQGRINDALCAQQETKPGDYRAAINFRVGSSGAVTALKLLSSTGDPRRDAAIVDTASRVAIGEPPPPRMAQPFTMVVLPRSSGGTVDCPPVKGDQQHG
jgi:TonB family protein